MDAALLERVTEFSGRFLQMPEKFKEVFSDSQLDPFNLVESNEDTYWLVAKSYELVYVRDWDNIPVSEVGKIRAAQEIAAIFNTFQTIKRDLKEFDDKYLTFFYQRLINLNFRYALLQKSSDHSELLTYLQIALEYSSEVGIELEAEVVSQVIRTYIAYQSEVNLGSMSKSNAEKSLRKISSFCSNDDALGQYEGLAEIVIALRAKAGILNIEEV